MRILFWSGTFWPRVGGIEVLAADFLPALRARGHEVAVITAAPGPGRDDAMEQVGITVHRLPFEIDRLGSGELAARVFALRRRVAAIKRDFAPDLIHLNVGGASDIFHWLTANAHPAPLVAAVHGEWAPEHEPVMKQTLEGATWTLGCSEFILSTARHLAPSIGARSSVILNGLSAPSPPPGPLQANNPCLVCVCRLVRSKGVDLAIEAFAMVVREVPRARLLIAGDGPERAELERQIEGLGLQDRVRLLGVLPRREVFDLLDQATAVLVPSREEAFGLTAIEAAWMARPVIASVVGGLPEVVAHGETGLLVEPHSPGAIARAALHLLLHPEAAVRMGQAGRKRAEQHFGLASYLAAHESLYLRLVR